MTEPGSAVAVDGDGRSRPDQLIGRRIPQLQLVGDRGSLCDLRAEVLAFPVVVLYFYPGAEHSPDEAQEALLVDAGEHRAFRDRLDDFVARNYRPIGISSETSGDQRTSVVAHNLQHLLLSDPRLLLARGLGVPTYKYDGATFFRRATMIVNAGIVEKLFFPVKDAARNAAQVLAWLQVHGL